jgi:deoxyribodipyrimidine photo-lyase
MQQKATSIMWFRRDLRLTDNSALYHALKSGNPVLPVFIFDTDILDKLDDKADKRVAFIHATITELQKELAGLGSSMEIKIGQPSQVLKALVEKYNVQAVFTNHDYERYALERDKAIADQLKINHIAFSTYKDQVIFEKDEVVKDDGKPYTVFTPYSRKWKSKLTAYHFKPYPTEKYFSRFLRQEPLPVPTMKQIGFTETAAVFPAKELDTALVKHYGDTRDFPGTRGTSRLGVHFRFGTISIRQAAEKASTLSGVYLNELIWRDFYQMILWHFPQVGMGRSFKPAYDHIEWRNNEQDFDKWCKGQTGYPIVDAGMRELNETGFMHNRVRMIVASFLCKHLLLDWRWGEAYFAEKLLDFDLASNNGGWQWAAGSGCDAAPYFRIFNPYLQTKKFDPQLTYIKKWVPEFQELTYPAPMVDHEFARKRCLEVYAKALKKDQ